MSDKVKVPGERELYLEDIKRKKRATIILQISILVGFILLWELLAHLEIIDDFIMSRPTRILNVLFKSDHVNFWHHLLVTVTETITGFILGVIGGTVIASALWWSEFFAKVFEPFLVILNSLPKIALGPVIIIIFGAGMQSIIVMALAISLIVTILEMLSGFLHTNEERIKMVKTFGAKRLQIFLKIVFPSNLHVLFNSLKVNIGLSLVGVIAGEFLVSKAGLGYLIVYGGQVFQMDLVMSSVLILAIVAAVMYQGVVLLQKYILRAIDHSA